MDGEFDIGTILYVVITLVVVLVGLLGRKKKPAGAGSQPGQTGREDDLLQKLEKVFNMGREEGVEVEEVREDVSRKTDMHEQVAAMKRERSQEVETRATGMWKEYEALHKTEREDQQKGLRGSQGVPGSESTFPEVQEIKEGESVFSDVQEPADQLDVIELGVYEGYDFFDIVRDFNATTAVIYSAIINRTEY
ncbi:MAG TPA: hypothetical protein ENO20_09680 [Bacteroides sp.]|nr:hypothetical protein [Bacteroides sp.]